ncbi:hypothetical protein V6U90_14455 [Micromonospora sp. CPCC 206060]
MRPAVHLGAEPASAGRVVPTGVRCTVDTGPRTVRGQRAPPVGCRLQLA